MYAALHPTRAKIVLPYRRQPETTQAMAVRFPTKPPRFPLLQTARTGSGLRTICY